MTQSNTNPAVHSFAREAAAEAARAFAALRDTGTLSPSGTVSFLERVPGESAAVSIRYPGPFRANAPVVAEPVDLDGTYLGANERPDLGGARYLPVLRAHPHITSIAHVHTPYLGGWAQSHQPLPIRYVAVQRWTRAGHLPVYVDRTQGEASFIIAALNAEPTLPAILEANGGATAFGSRGLTKLAETILLLEEGARFQLLAEPLGGAQPYGPGVLEQQWRRTGLLQPDDVAG